eukprot:1059686-Pyramimonas_sp.AAC.1
MGFRCGSEGVQKGVKGKALGERRGSRVEWEGKQPPRRGGNGDKRARNGGDAHSEYLALVPEPLWSALVVGLGVQGDKVGEAVVER